MSLSAHRLYLPQGICLTYRVEMSYLRKWLPGPLQPRSFNGYGLASIHFAQVQTVQVVQPFPVALPGGWRAAVRIPVFWENHFQRWEGVYSPQKYTSSRLLAWNPGRVGPGDYRKGKFRWKTSGDEHRLSFRSGDQYLKLAAKETRHFPLESVFDTLEQAAWLYARPGVVVSPRASGSVFEQMEGKAIDGMIQALNVRELQTSFSQPAETWFPKGAFHFDHALLLTRIREDWRAAQYLIRQKPLHLDPRFPDWQRHWTGNSDAERTSNR